MTAIGRLDWEGVGWASGAAMDGAVLASLAAQDAEMDRQGVWPEAGWRAAGALGVHRWHVPREYGGDGLDRDALLGRGARLAEASLVLAFIASQQDAAVRRLAAVKAPLAASWLERIASGEAVATVGLSHLTTSRRLGNRPMVAAPTAGGGYVLNGAMPWVTSATRADVIVTGAVLEEDGRQILVALPTSREGVDVGAALPLAALGASCTSEVACRKVEIAKGEVLYGPATDVAKLPGLAGTGGLETSALAIGKARAAILGLFGEAETRPELVAPAESLATEWREVAGSLLRAARGEEGGGDPGALRVAANSAVLRASQAYLTAAKGSGFVLSHPSQRWAREALFFLVWSCPSPVSRAMIESFSC